MRGKLTQQRIEAWLRGLLAGKLASETTVQTPMTSNGLTDWRRVLSDSPVWENAKLAAENGDTILIPTSVGGFTPGTTIEGLLGVALTLRGAKVHFVLCDGMLPACLQVHLGKVRDANVLIDYELKDVACPGCSRRGNSVYGSTGLPVIQYSDHITQEKRRELNTLANEIDVDLIPDHSQDGTQTGEHALAGTLRFFSSGHLPETPTGEQVLRRYFESALVTNEVMSNVIDDLKPKAAVFHHGIYVPQGIVGDVARRRDVRVVNWNVGYRKKCFIFSHEKTYHHTLIDEPTSNWEDIEWTDAIDKTTMQYLDSRRHGTQDWIWFHDRPQHEIEVISKETGLDFSKPVISLLTNVFWDAQLHYKANAFNDMLDWLLQSIEYFKGRPDLQLAIRIHPAEVRGSIPSRQPIEEEIRKAFPDIPANVFIISPESQISTYALCENSDSVIIYGTKTGVELSAFGVPVIVGGEAWIRNKGLTLDATSPEVYFNILETLPLRKRLDDEKRLRAKKYAYHFFFRRFVPIALVEESKKTPPYVLNVNEVSQLLPGKDKGLDVICDGILTGTEFIYPAELD